MKLFIDQVGTTHKFKTTPQRIISLVPSQSELLHDLGLENFIVGITKFCIHPNHLKATKGIVGGTKKVDYEKIRLLLPDIIICNKEENTKEIVEQLSKICPVWVTNIFTIDDNFQMINDFGELFDKRNEAQILTSKITFALNDFNNFIKDVPFKNVAYFIWKTPYMVAGSDTFINELLKLNHFQNAYEWQDRYPEINLDRMEQDGKIDLLLLSSEPYPFQADDGLDLIIHTKNAKVVLVDGEMFSWYGSRLIKAFEYFKILHKII